MACARDYYMLVLRQEFPAHCALALVLDLDQRCAGHSSNAGYNWSLTEALLKTEPLPPLAPITISVVAIGSFEKLQQLSQCEIAVIGQPRKTVITPPQPG